MNSFLKNEFFGSYYEKYFKICLTIFVVLLFFGFNVAFGWLMGNLFFFLSMILKNEYFEYILTMKSFNKGLFVLYYLASMILMIASFGLGFLFPMFYSVFAGFFGYLGFKAFLFVSPLFGGETLGH